MFCCHRPHVFVVFINLGDQPHKFSEQQWTSSHSTLSLFEFDPSSDYFDFYDSFMGEGFSLLINLAEGGDFPGTSDVLVDGQPQYVVVQEAKAYGF